MVKRPNRFNSYQGPKLYSLLPNDIQSDKNLPYSQRDAIIFYWKAEYSSFFSVSVVFSFLCGWLCVRACVRGYGWVCACVWGEGGGVWVLASVCGWV